jgi:hypothetical protein
MTYSFFFLWFMFAFALALLASTHILLRRIKLEDPTLYRNLGEPDLFRHNDIFGVYKFWHWTLFARSAHNLSITSRRIAWCLRISTPIYLALIAIGAFALV